MNRQEIEALAKMAPKARHFPASDMFFPPKPPNPDGKLRDALDLGQIIRDRRQRLGLTQIELAKACKCSPRFISELERGVAVGNIKQVIEVSRQLGIDLYARPRG